MAKWHWPSGEYDEDGRLKTLCGEGKDRIATSPGEDGICARCLKDARFPMVERLEIKRRGATSELRRLSDAWNSRKGVLFSTVGELLAYYTGGTSQRSTGALQERIQTTRHGGTQAHMIRLPLALTRKRIDRILVRLYSRASDCTISQERCLDALIAHEIDGHPIPAIAERFKLSEEETGAIVSAGLKALDAFNRGGGKIPDVSPVRFRVAPPAPAGVSRRMTRAEAAKVLKCSPHTVQKHYEAGCFPNARRRGARVELLEFDVLALKEKLGQPTLKQAGLLLSRTPEEMKYLLEKGALKTAFQLVLNGTWRVEMSEVEELRKKNAPDVCSIVGLPVEDAQIGAMLPQAEEIGCRAPTLCESSSEWCPSGPSLTPAHHASA